MGLGAALALGFLGSLVWLVGATCLSLWMPDGEVVRQGKHPFSHTVWSVAVKLCLAVLGSSVEHV